MIKNISNIIFSTNKAFCNFPTNLLWTCYELASYFASKLLIFWLCVLKKICSTAKNGLVWCDVVRMYSAEKQVAAWLSAWPGPVIGVSTEILPAGYKIMQHFLVHFCPASINCFFPQHSLALSKYYDILQGEWWIRPYPTEWVTAEAPVGAAVAG